MKLADIGIQLYAAESAVLRTQKALVKNGEVKEMLKVDLTKALLDDALLQVEMSARKMMQGISGGRALKDSMALVSCELNRLHAEESNATKRRIAAAILEAEQYIS